MTFIAFDRFLEESVVHFAVFPKSEGSFRQPMINVFNSKIRKSTVEEYRNLFVK